MVAEAQGLQGAALWQSHDPESRTKTTRLLKQAVADLMAPRNADYLNNAGIRKEVRELIFAAYMEAVANEGGEDAINALGPADWVHGGVVQQALADAAVRSAVNDPAMSDIVRREQDARNEELALRKYLDGEAGGASGPLPVVAAKMRARVAELEKTRQELQAQIKQRFPDYDKLVRQQPPAMPDIVKALGEGEALVVLLPTENGTYAWAVAHDVPAKFVKIDLTEAQVADMVKRVRRTLDFAEMGGRVEPFNTLVASELYQRLLMPLKSVTRGKPQLVISGGAP